MSVIPNFYKTLPEKKHLKIRKGEAGISIFFKNSSYFKCNTVTLGMSVNSLIRLLKHCLHRNTLYIHDRYRTHIHY